MGTKKPRVRLSEIDNILETNSNAPTEEVKYVPDHVINYRDEKIEYDAQMFEIVLARPLVLGDWAGRGRRRGRRARRRGSPSR